ncbi:MAG: hypothetical protein KF841_06665 [Phycisphaerae bacterium]|nr:hypothetical protein [Phycisphaerae bacterium]
MSRYYLSAYIAFLMVLGAVATPLAADSGPAGATPTDAQRKAEALRRFKSARLAFVKDLYALDGGQASNVEAWMESQAAAHQSYMAERELTLRRREVALTSLITKMRDISDATRDEVARRMQEQIYDIYSKAPLSLANTARYTESILSPDMVELGRKMIQNRHADKLGVGPVDIARLDRLLVEPVRVGSGEVVFPARASTAAADTLRANATKEARSSGAEAYPASNKLKPDPRAAEDSPVMKKPPPPSAPEISASSAPLEPAPPIDQWKSRLESMIARYELTDDQRSVAESIFESCQSRAQRALEAKHADIEKAESIPDEASRAKALRTLTKEADRIFSEMCSRIEAVASVEQRNRAAQRDRTAESN